MSLLGSKPHHPNQQIIGQDAGLEQGGISPKILRQNTPRGHLVFAPFDPILAGRPFPVKFVGFPKGKVKVRYIAKELIFYLGKQESLGVFLNQLAHCYKTAGSFPIMAAILKLGHFPARSTPQWKPSLGHQEFYQTSETYFEQVLTLPFFNSIYGLAIEKSVISTPDDLPYPLREATVTLFNELNGAIA
jgi:hypothetical protein